LLARLAQLKQAIDSDMVEAQRIMDAISASVAGSEHQDEVGAIAKYIEEFDSDAAKQLIERLQVRLI
jgi:hypothetical protein